MKTAIEPIEKKINDNNVEIVERKGIGHPDSLADGISEKISRKLSEKYRKEFGNIAHHNTDEVQIVGGKSNPEFGGGSIVEPIFILLAGRATKEFKGKSINVKRIAKEAAREHLNETIGNLDPVKHTEVECRISEGSSDLTEMYSRGKIPLSNDTSFGIGHAPLSETEKLVLRTEKFLNSEEFKSKYPSVGEDIKVMGLRRSDSISLTIASAFVGKHVDDLDMYINLNEELEEEVKSEARKVTEKELKVRVNTADSYENESVYLTTTGTSAEMGDDGSTGRGNRVNGLITPDRPMSLEASSGKNPIAHIGKIYNFMADHIAGEIVKEVGKIQGAYVKLLSQIGQPINKPQIACIKVNPNSSLDKGTENEIKEVSDYWIENIPEVMNEVIKGNIRPY